MKKFFYIIQRNGQIFEIEDIGNRLQDCLNLWQQSGLILFPNLGININGADVSSILNAEQYNNYIDSSQPKMFIKNGTWFDIKERSNPVRYEKWREIEMKEKKLLNSSSAENVDAQEVSRLVEKYRPEFIKRVKNKND